MPVSIVVVRYDICYSLPRGMTLLAEKVRFERPISSVKLCVHGLAEEFESWGWDGDYARYMLEQYATINKVCCGHFPFLRLALRSSGVRFLPIPIFDDDKFST